MLIRIAGIPVELLPCAKVDLCSSGTVDCRSTLNVQVALALLEPSATEQPAIRSYSVMLPVKERVNSLPVPL